MTFRPDPSATALCNRALSRLSQAPISGIDPPTPPSPAARACLRWYKPTIGRLLELHEWGLARARTALVETTNNRSEWLFAYALPLDVAFPVSLSSISSTGGLTYYQGLAGLFALYQGRRAFLKAGRVLYSQFSGDLDYISYDITEADFNATFENIAELTLAAAICFDITKNRAREKDLREQATSAINIAIAQNLGIGQPRYGDRPSERDIVRGDSFAMPSYGWNWDWQPGTS